MPTRWTLGLGAIHCRRETAFESRLWQRPICGRRRRWHHRDLRPRGISLMTTHDYLEAELAAHTISSPWPAFLALPISASPVRRPRGHLLPTHPPVSTTIWRG